MYPKKYAHGFVVLCFAVVMQSFIMNSHEVFIHIHQGCFAGTGAIVGLPQCQWSKPDGYGKISQCSITTTKHSKAKTVCIFLGIYCSSPDTQRKLCYYTLSTSQYSNMPAMLFNMLIPWVHPAVLPQFQFLCLLVVHSCCHFMNKRKKRASVENIQMIWHHL